MMRMSRRRGDGEVRGDARGVVAVGVVAASASSTETIRRQTKVSVTPSVYLQLTYIRFCVYLSL